MTYALTYLSLGAGRQSTALGIISALGLYECPKADVAIFADTGDEGEWTYDHLWKFSAWMQKHDIPVHVAMYGHLSHDLLNKRTGGRARPPLFTLNLDGSHGMIQRQCTQTYKIKAIEKHVKLNLLNVKRGARVPKDTRALSLHGISLDECGRMKNSNVYWYDIKFPLVDARLRVSGCEKICLEHLGYVPGKSSCVFCPYHGDGFWRNLKTNHPKEWDKAVAFEQGLPHAPSLATLRATPFLHKSCVPLDQVDLGEKQGDFFGNECGGYCGV